MKAGDLTALEDTELVLEEMFRHTPVGVVLSDLHGTIIDVNPAFRAMVGYERDELVGRPIYHFIHPEDLTDSVAQMSKLREGAFGSYETTRRYLTRGGQALHVKVSASVVYSKGGEPAYGIGFAEDITERLRMEDALREGEARYRRVVEDQTEMIVRCLPDGTRTFVNQAYCRYNDATAEELLDTSFFPCIVEEERELVRRKFAALTPGNPVITDEHHVIRPDGVVRWHQWTDRGFFDEAGGLIEVQAVGRDLTEEFEARNLVERNEERYRRLFNSLPVAAWETDWTGIMAELRRRDLRDPAVLAAMIDAQPQIFFELGAHGKIVDVNPVALELAGVGNLEEYGAWLKKAYTPESARRHIAATAPLILGDKRMVTAELTLLRANGEPVDILFRLARSERWGEDWMMFAIAVDLTDRKRMERELLRADKMISLGILVSGVAHEINNPNQAIMLNMPLLRDAWRDAAAILDQHAASLPSLRIGRMPWDEARGEVAEMLDDVEHAAERIRTIVKELRGFALDHDPGVRSAVAINAVVESSLRLAGNHIRKATRRFELELADEVPHILGNARRLEQVIVNLLINACQALRSEEQSIRIVTGADPRTAHVFVRVMDEGCGIAPEHLGKIRDPFFTTKRAAGGTGLGLAVSDRIAGEHGGELHFESVVGRGTTATLWLPLAGRETA